MTRPSLALPLLLLLTVAGCPAPHDRSDAGQGGGGGCVPVVLGDPTKPIQLELLYIGEGGQVRALHDCDDVDLVEPPQGGEVFFVGAKVTNITSCVVKITGIVRQVDGTVASGIDIRTVVISPIADRPGWGQTSTMGSLGAEGIGFPGLANVSACANHTNRDLQNFPHLVEITILDTANGHTGTTSMRVVPRCAQPDAIDRARCECLCSANYVDGKCNITDWDAGTHAPVCGDGGTHD